ncbi:sterile alpha motif domain-containing protein 9-like protein [Plakobranchus ocellatus]|uniref:Sterile alpha motif domain-containing protein 9-like protein n=1 Tax=Plakobranchus ocellatus TaxID=259542 RepID=A0AAV4BH59_9GAST|nr:sterile alpha motif domain-containing protein 9-like protein [Plakobranchus ocellatus]
MSCRLSQDLTVIDLLQRYVDESLITEWLRRFYLDPFKIMNSQDWERIQKNWHELTHQPNPKELADYLASKYVLSKDDVDDVQASGTPKRCMIKLLEILRKKAPSLEAYKHLLDAIRCEGTPWLADTIAFTPVDGDSAVSAKSDPKIVEDTVRTALLKHFCTRKGSETPLKTVSEILKEDRIFHKMDTWSDENIAKFVTTVFAGVEQKKKKMRKKMKDKTVVVLKNLCRKEEAGETQQHSSTSPHQQQGPDLRCQVNNMSCVELKQYLKDKLQEKGMSMQFLEDLETNEISGSVFLTLKEDDMKEILPRASFGVRRSLADIIKELSVSLPSGPEMRVYLRKFDSPVTTLDKYHYGRCCEASCNVTDKTTHPLKLFNVVDKDEDKDQSLSFICESVVAFASACMNNRRNGTIYFGIHPADTDTHRRGEVVGIDIPQQDVEDAIRHSLAKSFLATQSPFVKHIVRDPKFVPVLVGQGQVQKSKDLWVVEVDIKPSADLLKEDMVITLLQQKRTKKGVFGFSEHGVPERLNSERELALKEKLSCIVNQRKKDESEKKIAPQVDLRSKLLDLLTGGSEVMQDDVYIFFMLSPLGHQMDQDYLSENTLFIKSLKAELVFDFDPKGSTDGLYYNLTEKQEESMNVFVTDNFDLNLTEKDNIEKQKKRLLDISRTAWIFCNGYSTMDVNPVQRYDWKKERKIGFQKALDIFIENLGKERIILIICLFSDNYEPMLDASDEAISRLKNGWMVLAESEEVFCKWSENMLVGCSVNRDDLKNRCVIGMSWAEVNSTICQATQMTVPQQLLLPTSKGARIQVNEKNLKNWCDLEILTAGELNESDKKGYTRKDMEEKFYKGEQAQWLNFWFEGQVLKRDIHEPLMKRVKDALKGKSKDEENTVTVVHILHQPGAGGTTSARQILWDLRTKYRCCLVHNITESTLDQLYELRRFGDLKPMPPLVLMDNEDEEKYMNLRGNLEERARQLSGSTNMEDSSQVYFTILLCHRRASLPMQILKDQTILRQELKTRELKWFEHKSRELEKGYRTDRKKNVNPKFLISFNILKENFKKEYITRVVKEFTEGVFEPKEIELLKYVSFLNTYDPYFKFLKVSSLDRLIKSSDRIASASVGQRRLQWEAQLSQSVKVLLNLSTNREPHRKQTTSIRVFNKIFAENILDNVKIGLSQTDSGIMAEICESGVFQHYSEDARHMKYLINNIVKKREMQADGKKKHKFSYFVLQVQEKEGAEAAVKILEHVFDTNKDPYTAQLISRFYMITLKNWQKAEKFAKRATDMLPLSSFLWDTYGQVFKEQLQEKVDEKDCDVNENNIGDIIATSRECIEIFKKEQEVCEKEVTFSEEINLAGYFGELRATILLLKALKSLPTFSNASGLYNFFVKNQTDAIVAKFLSEEEIDYLRYQITSSETAMRKLDDEFLQTKGNTFYDDVILPDSDNNRTDLIKLKVSFDEYFGGLTVPANISEDAKCEYRSTIARRLSGSLNQMLRLRSGGKGMDIKRIYDFMLENSKYQICSFNDMMTLLDAVTALLVDGSIPKELSYRDILEWSTKFFRMSVSQTNGCLYLEPFLYFTMYNFPTQGRQRENLCPVIDLKRAMAKWHEAFQKKYQKQGKGEPTIKKRETTLFFLGNGQPLNDIVHQDSLDERMRSESRQDKWKLPEVREKLLLLRGVLLACGDKVRMKVTNAEGNRFDFDITTSYRVKTKDMWQKQVYFYLGFSFSGPKAFGVSLEEPGFLNPTMSD